MNVYLVEESDREWSSIFSSIEKADKYLTSKGFTVSRNAYEKKLAGGGIERVYINEFVLDEGN